VQNKPRSLIAEGGKLIGQGITLAAEKLAEGIKYTGQYFKEKTNPQAPLKVTQETKNKVIRARTYSDKILFFTNKSIESILVLQNKMSKHAAEWMMKAGTIFYDPKNPNPKLQFLGEVA